MQPQPVTNPDQSELQGAAWGQLPARTHLGISTAETPNTQSGWPDEASCDAPDGRIYGNSEFSVGSGARGTLEGQVRVGGG